MDAGGRAELARPDDLGQGLVSLPGGGPAGLTLPRLLARRRCPRRPDGPAADPPAVAGRPALDGVPPRRPRLYESGSGLDDPRPVLRRGTRPILRRPRVSGARPDARRQGGSPERGRPELDPIQPGPRHRPRPRGRRVRDPRRRRVLRTQRPLVLRGDRRAPRAEARRADGGGERERPRQSEGRTDGGARQSVAPRAHRPRVHRKPLRVPAPHVPAGLREGRLLGRHKGPRAISSRSSASEPSSARSARPASGT